MTKLLALLLMMVLTVPAQAASLPNSKLPLFAQRCPPNNPYCKINSTGAANPPAVTVDENAPKACASDDASCIQTYSQTQTQNYQTGVKDPSFVSPVSGGGGCILSDQSQCGTTEEQWQTNTVQPTTSRQLQYDTGARPEFDAQKKNCKSVFSPFSRTVTQKCDN